MTLLTLIAELPLTIKWQFSDLVLDSSEEIESKVELSKTCLDCLGEILLVSRLPPYDLLLKTKKTNYSSLVFNCRRGDMWSVVWRLNEVVRILLTECYEILRVGELLEKFLNVNNCCSCFFCSILCFRNGHVYFYITDLHLVCEDHARLFTENAVPSHSAHSTSGHLQSCMKFLKALALCDVGYSLEGLGATVKHCNHLKVIDIRYAEGSLCHFLEHVPNPSMCSLSIKGSRLTSTEAEKFASLLPSFDVTHIDLYLAECSSEVATSLAAAIEQRTVEETELSLPPAEALRQSLPPIAILTNTGDKWLV